MKSPKLTTKRSAPDSSLKITIPRMINIAARIKLSIMNLRPLFEYIIVVVLKVWL